MSLVEHSHDLEEDTTYPERSLASNTIFGRIVA